MPGLRVGPCGGAVRAWQADGSDVEGFVDMVIEQDDGLEIVDWQTDAVPVEADPKRLQEYELQAGLYILGLEQAHRQASNTVTYVFVSAGVESSPGDLRELAKAVLADNWAVSAGSHA